MNPQADSDWIGRAQNVIITGPTGAGKSHLARSLAQAAQRDGHITLCFDALMLLGNLIVCKLDGTLPEFLQALSRTRLLIIDGWDKDVGGDGLLAIIRARQGVAATVITSQLPLARWHELISAPNVDNGTLEQFINGAHHIALTVDSIPKSDQHWAIATAKWTPMTTEEHLDTLETRLQATHAHLNRLEREVTGLRTAIAQKLQTKAVEITDEAGMVRAKTIMREDGPTLNFYDENGKLRLMMCVTATGPIIALCDENECRASVSLRKEGPYLSMYNATGVASAEMHCTDEIVALTLYDGRGKPRATMAVTEDGPAVLGLNENGKPNFRLP